MVTDVARPKKTFVKLQNNKIGGRIRFNEDLEEAQNDVKSQISRSYLSQ